MGQVFQRRDGLAHQRVGGPALQIGHQGDPAGVVLEPGIVEATDRGCRRSVGSARVGPGPATGVVGAGTGVPRLPEWVVIGSLQREKWIHPPGTTLALAWSEDCTRPEAGIAGFPPQVEKAGSGPTLDGTPGGPPTRPPHPARSGAPVAWGHEHPDSRRRGGGRGAA